MSGQPLTGQRSNQLNYVPSLFSAGYACAPAGENWTVANKSGKEMKLMVLEFKD
jgi:hypothetical protein